ncbi:30S ribosomal protein S6e [Candidatus Woesearchaeota archaeon]|nr:30S ribosomal protein S6e [Candidatus Woesearchaeota archaeon]MBW3016805.1 30S ribosomal protein S6e [Candidatus Woesearchaeota archaeon]
MATFKIVIGAKDGKSYQKEVKDDEASVFLDLKIGDKVSGDSFGFPGYEFEITGGSDNAGFPMRRDVDGRLRKRILTVDSPGVRVKGKGVRIRKTVASNSVYDNTSQINLKVLKQGAAPLGGEAAPAEGEAAEKTEEAKPEPKKEAKPEAKEG